MLCHGIMRGAVPARRASTEPGAIRALSVVGRERLLPCRSARVIGDDADGLLQAMVGTLRQGGTGSNFAVACNGAATVREGRE